jgi:hypothetical protein
MYNTERMAASGGAGSADGRQQRGEWASQARVGRGGEAEVVF